jgi:hypothetical protein
MSAKRDRVFVSYRRSDSAGHAGRLRDDLTHLLGARVFMDVVDIAPGDKFAQVLDAELHTCGAVLAIIGTEWWEALRAPRDGTDYVRVELRQSLEKDGVAVIPVLVNGAKLPSTAELPDDLASLADHQAIALRDDRWSDDVAYLARELRALLKLSRVPRWLVPTAAVLIGLAALAVWMQIPQQPADFDRAVAHRIAIAAAQSAGAGCKPPAGAQGKCPVLLAFAPSGNAQNVYFDAGYCDYKGTPFGDCLLHKLERTRVHPFDNVPTAEVELMVRVEPNGAVTAEVSE